MTPTPDRTALPRSRVFLRLRDDAGFAMVTVIGAMFALSLVVIASLSYATNEIARGQRSQDFQAAVAAAQAGVDDFLARLNTCDNYWATPCANSAADPALAGTWVTVPGSTGAGDPTSAQYRYRILSRPDSTATPGTIRLEATGRVGGTERAIVVDLRKKGFLEFIYYTDKESSDPLSIVERYPARTFRRDFKGQDVGAGSTGSTRTRDYSELRYAGVTAAEAAKCGRYYYGTTAAPGARASGGTETVTGLRKNTTTTDGLGTASFGCDIQFADIDTIDGRLHTNDAILLNNPLFKGRTTSSWPAAATPAPPSATNYFRTVSGGSGPKSTGQRPAYGDPIALPPDNRQIRDKTVAALGGAEGCLFTGATKITLRTRADGVGVMDVISPGTTSWNPGCQPGNGLLLPRNGVVYVDPLPTNRTCTGKAAGIYPIAGDITTYSCRSGDVFISGQLKGQLTVAAANDIVIVDDLTYRNGITGTDVLGLIANDFVQVYHPVGCVTPAAAGFVCSGAPLLGSFRDDYTNLNVRAGQPLTNITIDAAILSVLHSFTVQNFDKGPKLGTLNIRGGIYQNFRGPVGTGGASTSGTGYAKNYVYDPRLVALPPPSFINPLSAPWEVVSLSEQ